jgi:hypothetical protein
MAKIEQAINSLHAHSCRDTRQVYDTLVVPMCFSGPINRYFALLSLDKPCHSSTVTPDVNKNVEYKCINMQHMCIWPGLVRLGIIQIKDLQ